MSKIRTAGITVIILFVIGFILMNNKKHLAAISVPDIQSSIPVKVTRTENRALDDRISLVGRIAANNDVAIVAETEGRITHVYVQVGDRVKRGDALFQIDDELKQAAFASAEVNYEKAKRDLDRYQALHSDSTVSDAQLEGARLAFKSAEAGFITARRQLADTRVASPITGVITARTYDVGTRVKVGDLVANVVDIATLKVQIDVAEKVVFSLKAGNTAVVRTDVYPNVDFEAKIATISDKADRAHNYAVELELPNSDEHPLKAGMFARVELQTRGATPTLAIPRESIVGSLRDPHVYVIENNIAKLKPLVVAAEVGSMLAVQSGLREGEVVVTNGQNNLRDSANVTILQ